MGSARKLSSEGRARQLQLSDRDAEDLERLLRLLDRSAAAAEHGALQALARRIHSARALRTSYLPARMFGEPSWDILLSLYAGPGGGQASLDLLSQAAHAPITAILRWIDYLEEEGLVVREQLPGGPVVSLAHAGTKAVEAYLARLYGDEP